MKRSKILLFTLVLAQFMGFFAHAEIDPETKKRALEWVAEQLKKEAASKGKDQQAAKDEQAAKDAAKQATIDAQKKAEAEAEQKKAAEKAQKQAKLEAQKAAEATKKQAAIEAQKAAEAAKKQAAIEAQKAAEAAKKQAAIDTQKAAEAAQKQAAIEAQKKAEAEQKKAAQEAQAKAEAEKAQKQAELEAQKQAQEEQLQDQKPVTSSGMMLPYATVVKISDYKGTTFFSMMERAIKPSLDYYAVNGFRIADGPTTVAALSKVDKKVSNNAIRAAGSVENLKAVADRLSSTGQTYTFYDLPSALAQAGVGGGRFDLTTFFALISGGGVAVDIVDGTYAYNVNYGTGTVAKDEMTGRSFGEAPGRYALDASDSHYLQTLERYVRTSGPSIERFYLSILEILTNNDTSHFQNISGQGKAVASDFIAVYVAEQDRHLMANLQTHHWDQALLEVTLLSAFHAGQSEVAVMYQDRLTNRTHKQDNGCSTNPKIEKNAGMVDYWQFSTSTDPANCNRSGINITKKEFRKLGAWISRFERQRHPEIVARIESELKGIYLSGNLFADLSSFLINYKTPKSLDSKSLQLAKDFTAFLMQVRADADQITAEIQKAQ